MVYTFDGPVTMFGKVVSNRWYGETCAPSEKKAKTNLEYQFKAYAKCLPGSKIELIGKVLEKK